MFNNISTNDKYIRLVLAIIFFYFGMVFHPMFMLGSIAMFITAATNSCIIYKIMGINRKLEQYNYYLSLLPKYTPHPTLIFSETGQLLFKNKASYTSVPLLLTSQQLNYVEHSHNLIHKGNESLARYSENQKTYQFLLYGNKIEKIIMAYGSDITKIVEREALLRHYALTDALTQIPNRRHLIEKLESQSSRIQILALIDIKNFGQINSFYGHEIGDRFLQAFANLLTEFSKQNKTKMHRIQGDVFSILSSLSDETTCINKLHQFFEQKFITLDEIEFSVEVTIAYALKNNNGKNLLNQCETTLMEAKKNRIKTLKYDSLDHVIEHYHHNLECSKRIKHILSHEGEGSFVTYFQPIQNSLTGAIEKYEALARIIVNGSLYLPSSFIDPAKQLGLLPRITMEVLDSILQHYPASRAEFSINITIQDLQKEGFCDELKKRINSVGFPSEKLVLEILEDEEVYEYLSVLKTLKASGFKIAIDDFGTGYSNFSQLQRLEVDYIKIDGSLIQSINSDPKSLAVLRTIIHYAQNIGAKTIAEFVENETIAKTLIEEKIDYLQGYAISEPRSLLITLDN
ncbi:MAG: EAL domain-containing protein [Sulfuricurvum sp.]|nr:EAL domain-containing protein [Sulfuricurvum sp.]